MDVIDSQNLSHQDAYYHKFPAAGAVQWGLANLGNYTINVAPPPNNPSRTNAIELTWDGSQFQVPAPAININTADLVRWHNATPGPLVPPFSIVGTNFNSRSLAAGDLFSHQFALPGNYKYVITFKGGPQYGSVPVISGANPAGARVFRVTVTDGMPPNPDPPAAAIYQGDTVLWNIVSGLGVTIKNAS